jgi:hypothetical protein
MTSVIEREETAGRSAPDLLWNHFGFVYPGTTKVVPPMGENDQSFSVCVRTILSQLSPAGTS